MAKKRNKKLLKKRKKRYLKKQLNRSVKQPLEQQEKYFLNPYDIELSLLRETTATAPRTDLFLGKYEEENMAYQQELDQVYSGTVSPIERFVNYNANLLHVCSECKKEFFSKPLFLLKNANQKHVCGVDNSRVSPDKIRRKITEADRKKMVALFEQGYSKSKIAIRMGISRPTIINHLRKAGIE